MAVTNNLSFLQIIPLLIAVSYTATAFSLHSFVTSPSSFRSSHSGPFHTNTALHVWKTKETNEKQQQQQQQQQQVDDATEVNGTKNNFIRNIFDNNNKSVTNGSTSSNKSPDDTTNPSSLSSIPKLGEWTKFLRTETDDIWEEELATTAFNNDVVEEQGDGLSKNIAVVSFAVLGSITLFGFLGSSDWQESVSYVQQFFSNPTETLEKVVSQVESMGSIGQAYFAGIYILAEILAIPAIPLTASAGYLFGVKEGTLIVLFSASIAAAVSFIIGRTLLRDYVEEVLEQNPKFQQLDKAIGQEGFKLMLLLRLSPIFPFALSNYLYGATSVRFWPYFFGTMLGFTPGTIAYVYTGEIGKALTLESASAEPWYVYAGALAILTGFIKLAADVATGIIDGLEDDTEEQAI
jgi:uncharacterized membrane protein YdjX (TVP38/TMEM64 family)